MSKNTIHLSVAHCVCGTSADNTAVKFKLGTEDACSERAEIVFTATIDSFRMYILDHWVTGGPISATFNVEKISGATVVGKLQPKIKEIRCHRTRSIGVS